MLSYLTILLSIYNLVPEYINCYIDPFLSACSTAYAYALLTVTHYILVPVYNTGYISVTWYK